MGKFSFPVPVRLLVLPIFIRGETNKKLDMVLDTGATFTLISWDSAKLLGLSPEVSRERLEIVTASGKEIVPKIYLKEVRLLDKIARNVETVVHDLPKNSYAQGLLGLSFLNNFELTINFRTGKLAIK